MSNFVQLLKAQLQIIKAKLTKTNKKLDKIVPGSSWILTDNIYGSTSRVIVAELNLSSKIPSVTIINPKTGNMIIVTLSRFLQCNPEV